MQTVKDLADLCGVSKVAISKRIESLGLKDQLIKDGTRNLVPGEVAEKVIEYYKARNSTKAEKTADADGTKQTDENPGIYADIIGVLKDQLAEKDKQIERLQVLLAQQQQLMLPDKAHEVDAEETIDVDAEGTFVGGDDLDPDRKEAKRTIWDRLFR